jgi:hypothetical protein
MNAATEDDDDVDVYGLVVYSKYLVLCSVCSGAVLVCFEILNILLTNGLVKFRFVAFLLYCYSLYLTSANGGLPATLDNPVINLVLYLC